MDRDLCDIDVDRDKCDIVADKGHRDGDKYDID